tara:strand:- start:664 stop:963 length:300 start_codon:yes stop_codon:yes gene_type:complete
VVAVVDPVTPTGRPRPPYPERETLVVRVVAVVHFTVVVRVRLVRDSMVGRVEIKVELVTEVVVVVLVELVVTLSVRITPTLVDRVQVALGIPVRLRVDL